MGSNEVDANKMQRMVYFVKHQVATTRYKVIATLALLAAQFDRFSARLAATSATMPYVNLRGTYCNKKFEFQMR